MEGRGPGTADGVLGDAYARDRMGRGAPSFRYRVRAGLVAELVQRHLPNRTRYNLLELGCAEGRTLLEIRRLLGERGTFRGVEASEELIRQAPQLPADTSIVKGDAQAPPADLEQGGFDVVCALALLEHVRDPEAVAQAARKLLRPGGLFIATCPHPVWDYLAGRLRLLDEEAHLQEMDRERLLRVAHHVGPSEYLPFMNVVIGSLSYARIAASPALSARVDQALRGLPAGLRPLFFVNQAVLARRCD